MACEDLNEIDATTVTVGKLLYMIGKGYSIYVNRHIYEFGINTTQLHLLFEIYYQSDINQDKIAERCKINKKT